MNFNFENRSGGETRQFYSFVNLLSTVMSDLYKNNEEENYRQAIRDVSFKVCQYIEAQGIPLNRTPLTEDWLDSKERKDFRRSGFIK